MVPFTPYSLLPTPYSPLPFFTTPGAIRYHEARSHETMKEGMKKLFGGRERVVVLAADHRYFGVVAGLEKPGEGLTPLLPYVDVLMTDPGVLRHARQQR